MTTSGGTAAVTALLGISLYGAGLAAQHQHQAHASPGEGSPHYLTVNVSLTNAGIEPPTVFVPAGQAVQLMLRNRTTSEHHYRVVGLTPDEIAWVQRGGAVDASLAEPGHDHHNRQLVRSRTASPSGITPTGREIHGYVSAASNIDMVLFTATEVGTFVVQCDLHPEHVGSLAVFANPAQETAPLPAQTGPIRVALTRDLGDVDYAGVSGVHVEATYTPQDQEHVAILLMEQLHSANLPERPPAPELLVSGTPVSLMNARVVTDSVHHRITSYRFARDESFGSGHQVMTLRLASGQQATWHLPLMVPGVSMSGAGPAGFGESWALILALLGGMVAAMWPCLFQLTVYFIPALAGVAMQDDSSSPAARRRQVLRAAFFFILGFTLVYTATGAVIGYAAQRFGDTAQFEAWQRYVGVAAGVVVIGLALRVAAKVRAPLVCRMPILSGIANSKKPATRTEMMVAGLAFATGCMTCFGSALVVGMVVYIGLAQSALYGALVLFLFSLGMGIPLVIAAVAMARALPVLMKLETAVPWMGLASAVLMAGFGVLLITGNYMIMSEWAYRLVG